MNKKAKVLYILTAIFYIFTIGLFIASIIVDSKHLLTIIILGISALLSALIGTLLYLKAEKTRLSICPNCNCSIKDAKVKYSIFTKNENRRNRKTYVYMVKGTCPCCQNKFEFDVYISGKSENIIEMNLKNKLDKIYTNIEKND